MSGALLQLAALGSQDIYLTGNPEITLFKKAYLRYTNFSTDTIQVSFNSDSINFGSTRTYASIDVPLSGGDLISKLVLVLNLEQKTSTTKWGYVNKLGHAMIDEITIKIGQSIIDTYKYNWIDTYHNLYKNKSHEERYNIMIGNVPEMKKFDTNHPSYNIYLPLDFWFTKVSSSSFPICALKNGAMTFQILIKLVNAIDVVNYLGLTEPTQEELPNIVSGYALIDYICLEDDEKQLFQSTNHEYLIEQVQEMEDSLSSASSKVSLIFDKPCKYLIWYATLDKYFTRNRYLSWAFDDDWEKARNIFAKIVWLSTREGLNTDNVDNMIIVFADTFVNIGQVPGLVMNGNTILANLASKVNGIILFAEDSNGTIIAKATIENVILVSNTITMEDMSYTITELMDSNNTLQQQIDLMNYYTINVIDVFNTGNFINRTDNPIVLSTLQLNGKNRFQQRDAYFFNYLQPYYYFTNTPPDGINVYSFSLMPQEIQPSGTINLGLITSKDLIIQLGKYNNTYNNYFNTYFKSGRIHVFTLSYTLLKISQNQAHLSY